MSYRPPPILGPTAVTAPLHIVRQAQPAVNQEWVSCPICEQFGGESRFMVPEELRAWERHFDRCAEQHAEQLRAQTLEGKAPGLFGPDVGDVELRKWIAQHREAIIAGGVKI